MNINQIGASVCIVMCLLFAVFAVLFLLLKEKGAILISGFNSLSKGEQAQYDQKEMSRDMRNSLFLWSVVLFFGAGLSYFINYYFAVGSFIVWLVLFFKEVKFDTKKAFEKYKL